MCYWSCSLTRLISAAHLVWTTGYLMRYRMIHRRAVEEVSVPAAYRSKIIWNILLSAKGEPTNYAKHVKKYQCLIKVFKINLHFFIARFSNKNIAFSNKCATFVNEGVIFCKYNSVTSANGRTIFADKGGNIRNTNAKKEIYYCK